MLEKHNFKYVKEYIESFGCKLFDNKYVNSQTKLKIKYQCGHINNDKTFTCFKNSKKICANCSTFKSSYRYIKNYINSYNCELLSNKYKDINTLLKIKFICGHIEKKTFARFKLTNKKLCHNCSIKNNLDLRYNEAKKYIESKGCKLISKNYIRYNSLLEIFDQEGHLYKVSFDKFKNNNQIMCLKCVKKKLSKRFLKPMEEVISILENSSYKYIKGKYRDNNCKISIQDKDGYKYYTSISAVRTTTIKNINGNDAKIYKFDSSNIYTLNNIKLWLKINRKNFYLMNSVYSNAHDKTLKFCCFDCGNIWLSNWNNIKNGKECPQCCSSKGEKRILRFLEKQKDKISFVSQFSFNDCIYKRKLRFDFGIFKNKNMYMCEYNGKLHYEPVKFYRGEDYFIKIQKKDKIKSEYCKKNNILMIIIPYWEYKNIETILSKELSL